MATNAGTIFVNLQANIRNFKKNMGLAQKEVGSFSKRMVGFVKQHKLAIAAAGAAVAAIAFKLTKAASDLEETQAKFNTVFRGVTVEAEKSAQILQDSFLLSETAAKANLAAIQDTLVPMGLMRDAAQEISFEVVKLAADLGSFNNLPTEQVMRDIQSALVGNFETMKKYGVVLKATDIQNRILNQGIASQASEITNAQRVTAAYQLILEGTEDAQGDVARTSESFANQVKGLQSAFKDLSATLGKFLLKDGTALVTWLKTVLKLTDETIKSQLGELTVNEETARQTKARIAQLKTQIRLNMFINRISLGAFESIGAGLREELKLRTDILKESTKQVAATKEEIEAKGVKAESTVQFIDIETQHDLISSDERIQQAIKEGAIRNELNENMKKFAFLRNKFVMQINQQMFQQFGDGVADMIIEGRRFSEVIKSIWKDLARSVISLISQMIAKWLAFQILTGGSAGGFGAATKFLGFAHGGVINSPSIIRNLATGETALAGESGPEFIVPQKSAGGLQQLPPGQAAARAGVGGGGGGQGMNLTINIQGSFIEGSATKWQELIKRVIVPEIRRFTQSVPIGPFNRKRGATV